MKLFLIFVN